MQCSNCRIIRKFDVGDEHYSSTSRKLVYSNIPSSFELENHNGVYRATKMVNDFVCKCISDVNECATSRTVKTDQTVSDINQKLFKPIGGHPDMGWFKMSQKYLKQIDIRVKTRQLIDQKEREAIIEKEKEDNEKKDQELKRKLFEEDRARLIADKKRKILSTDITTREINETSTRLNEGETENQVMEPTVKEMKNLVDSKLLVKLFQDERIPKKYKKQIKEMLDRLEFEV